MAVLILFVKVGVSAQEKIGERYDKAMEHYPIRFEIKAGPSFANLAMNNASTVNNKNIIPAWHVAGLVDIPLLPVLSVQGGIQVGMKGAKFTVGDNSSNTFTNVSTHPIYLEVPLNLVVKIPIVNKVKLFAGAGPYLAAGIGGKNKLDGQLLGVSFSNDNSIQYNSSDNSSNYNNDLRRFDAGLNFLAGLEISHLSLNANYGYGLSNIKSSSDNNSAKYSNRVVSISIGVLF